MQKRSFRITASVLFALSCMLLFAFQNCADGPSSSMNLPGSGGPVTPTTLTYSGDIEEFAVSGNNFVARGPARCRQLAQDDIKIKVEILRDGVTFVDSCPTVEVMTTNRLWGHTCGSETNNIFPGSYTITVRAKHPSATRYTTLATRTLTVTDSGGTVTVDPPTLLAVTNDSDGKPVDVNWVAPSASTPTGYDLDILQNATVVKTFYLVERSKTIASMVIPDGNYTWRVRTVSIPGTSTYAEGPMFTVNTQTTQPVKAPGPTGLTKFPANGAPSELRWTPTALAAGETSMKYYLEAICSDNCNTANPNYIRDVDSSNNPTSKNISDILPGNYTWTLRAVPVGGTRLPSDAVAGPTFTIPYGKAPMVNASTMQHFPTSSSGPYVLWSRVDANEGASYNLYLRDVTRNIVVVNGALNGTNNWYHLGTAARAGNYEWKVQTRRFGVYTADSDYTVIKTFTVTAQP